MTLPALPTAREEPRLGRDAGWALAFFSDDGAELPAEPLLLVGSASRHAEIHAALPDGLAGGRYQLVIEGLSDGEYAELKGAAAGELAARLYLGWRDANEGFFAHLATGLAGVGDLTHPDAELVHEDNLIAELRVTRLSRRAGRRRYEVVVEARERVFDTLVRHRLDTPRPTQPPLGAAVELVRSLGMEPVSHPTETLPAEAPPERSAAEQAQRLERGRTFLDALQELERAMAAASGLAGRGLALIRDGTLHLGKRPLPLGGADTPVTAEGGLLAVEQEGRVRADPTAAAPDASPPRRRFRVTLLGRADLKPGEVIRVSLPPEEDGDTTPAWSGLLGEVAAEVAGGDLLGGASGGEEMRLYLVGVEHRLGRTSGFATRVSGLELHPGEDGWDRPSASHEGHEAHEANADSAEERAARAIRSQAERAARERRFPEVGEVRAASGEGDDPPAQTLTVWRGLAPPDGRPNGAARLPVARPSPLPAAGVAYLTPFAWGRCGLVVPHYFGSRVLLAHRNGDRGDPVVLGALWASGEAPASQPGDWWLSLPVGAAGAWAAGNDEAVPEAHTGPVAQDLIDKDGNRVIEVGELTVRVRREGLKNAGERPERGDADTITIEHADGNARIAIAADGSVRISGSSIELSTGGELKLSADRVRVETTNGMDVS